MPRKLITLDHFEERIAIKLEAVRHPTEKQEHDVLNECLREFRELYGELDIPQWPRTTDRSSGTAR